MLAYVIENGRVDVSDLSGIFAVSEVTVRKDLDKLARAGLIRRHHGYAIPVAPDNMMSRMAYHHDEKRRIARAALAGVRDGDLVMIESGSACVFLAEEIAQNRRGVTIITNSAFIADYIRTTPAKVVLLGGDYQNEAQVTVGPITIQTLNSFYVEKCFIGIDGYTSQYGFTAKDHMRAEVVRAMAKQSEELIVLSESSKFARRGAVPLVDREAVSQIFTDDALAVEFQKQLAAAGIKITKTPTTPAS